VPRACEEVLAAVAARSKQGIAAAVSLSYVEVFGRAVHAERIKTRLASAFGFSA